MQRRFRHALSTLVLMLTGTSVSALEPIAVLTPSDVPAGYTNLFGASSAISGDYIVFGAPSDPWYNGDSEGAVYVFRRIGSRWIEQTKFTSPEPAVFSQFGAAVAMEGDVILVGQPHVDLLECGDGEVHVFRRNDQGTPGDPGDDTWSYEAELAVPNPEPGAGLGSALAISGNVVVAGGECGNRAQVFRRIDGVWTHEATLAPSDPDTYEGFGESVDIDPGRIAIGADWHDERRGAAYVFVYAGGGQWVPEGPRLTFQQGQPRDDLGRDVAISGEWAIAGAPNADDPDSSAGAAHVFKLHPGGKWIFHSTLSSARPALSTHFGWAIACDSASCIVAQRGTPHPWGYDPWGYLFESAEGKWTETETLGGFEDSFGVSIDGNYAVISTYLYVVRNRKSTLDFARFQNCFGPVTHGLSAPECQLLETEGDNQVDLDDFAEFLAIFGGP
jgi:hypothetical protein